MHRETRSGPWLVAAGAALWGTESAWRIPLNEVLRVDAIVFWEHVLLVLCFLPAIAGRLHELRRVGRRALGYLIFSGLAGSAVGTVFFTLALKHGNATVVNVVLAIQPVLSTTAAVLLFHDRLAPRFFVWAPIAVVAGGFLSVQHPGAILSSFQDAGLDEGTGYALVCAVFWGLATTAGRGVMLEMSLPLASGLRFVVGLVGMLVILAVRGELNATALWPPIGRSQVGSTALELVLLATLSGGLPLLLYFQGLKHTRASTAGYFETFQTLSAVVITWGVFGERLLPHQVAAALVLVGAVAMVQRVQERTQRGA